MLEYSKLKDKRHLTLAFNEWKQKKRQKDAKKHFSGNLMKKVNDPDCGRRSDSSSRMNRGQVKI